ncbi:MAG TPA: response regulator transcription factor [Saprospiraceae bacterium]|nr:response regulator transcription factor [Saprospiraceae bacterium]MCC6688430.1 response regulator transcription factor [Saprospiraceae bacterium]HMV24631.1 response regulator transcription factor [Saprospiraceae bacterium]HMW74765.1 response regulator transcription factor [Saprospiraceae bacterium]HMX84099.1 response regulator transcription factor [Saprospiraceae bacterium]
MAYYLILLCMDVLSTLYPNMNPDRTQKSLLVLDDSEIIYWGIVMLCSRNFPDCRVYYADSGDDCIKKLREKHFDVILMDVNILFTDTSQVLRLIRLNFPLIRVVIFSNEKAISMHFVDKGADGFIRKSSKSIDLISQLGKVIYGENINKALLDLDEGIPIPIDRLSLLTPREYEIMNFLLKGYKTTEISAILKLQKTTVSTHKAKIFQKLNVSNTLELKAVTDSIRQIS